MLKVKIVCVGKIKEKYFKDAIEEYAKRLSRFCSFSVVEVEEGRIDKADASQIEKALAQESKAIFAAAKNGFVVVLDRCGKQCDSEEFSQILKRTAQTASEIVFVVGSSFGLAQEVKQKADLTLSFGAITLPHQLFRVVLAEQIYRGFSMLSNSAYHK